MGHWQLSPAADWLRRAGRNQVTGRWQPPPSFAARFREHIRPRLKLRLPDAAWSVVYGLASYSDAWGDLWWFAWFRGASFLSGEMALDLEEWLHRRLIEEIDRVEAEVGPNISGLNYLAEPLPASDVVWAAYDAGHRLEVTNAAD